MSATPTDIKPLRGAASARPGQRRRLVVQAWTLEEVAAELGAARSTLWRLLDQHQVRPVAPTRRQRAAAATAGGPKQQARAAQRRQARLAELGLDGLEAYLRDRYRDKAPAGGGDHRPGSHLPDCAGGAATGGLASNRSVCQQRGRM